MNSGRLALGAAEPEVSLPAFQSQPLFPASLQHVFTDFRQSWIDTTMLVAFLLDGDFAHTQAPPVDQGLSEQERCACPLQ